MCHTRCMIKDNDILFERKKYNELPPSYNFNYYNVRNNAWEFLIKNDVKKYPLNLQEIVDKNNWIIWSYKYYCKIKNIDEAKLIEKYPDGFTSEDRNGNFLICYNGKNNKQRNRFTICHEIGHIVLRHLYKNEKLETEANMFSARILMPMLLIKELKITSPEELARLCDVSIESATFRLKRFNEIKERERFYTNPLEIQLLEQLKDFLSTKE